MNQEEKKSQYYRQKPKVNVPPLDLSKLAADSMKKQTQRERSAEIILRWQAPPNETIRHCSFVDDERPHYIFILLENEQTHCQSLKLLKIQGHEYVMPNDSESSSAASQIFRKPPFGVEELEKKNRKLESIVRQKFIDGEVRGRKAGSDNFFCNIEDSYNHQLRRKEPTHEQANRRKMSDQEALEDSDTMRTAEFGELLKRDVEEAKNDSSVRLVTEVVPDSRDTLSSDDEQFQLMRPPSKSTRRQ